MYVVSLFCKLNCNFFIVEMNLISSLVRYGGKWDKSTNTYLDYEVAGILIPYDCSLQNLKSLISNEIGASIDEFQITYQLRTREKPIKILTDNSIKFYIEMRKSCIDVTELPLCLQPALPTSSTDTVLAQT